MTNQSVRLAFRIGYLGDAYHGSQVQPDVKTVQGELIRVFQSLKWLDKDSKEHNLVLSSRTDAGVHVRVNGGIVHIDRALWSALTPRKMIRALDDRLPNDIAFLDVREVDETWNPRLANHRVYRYRLEGLEFWTDPGEQFTQWLRMFEGTYDATNFARLEEGKNPMRTVYSCTPWIVENRTVGFEIIGEAFVWNQVRRIASALYYLVTEYYDEELVLRARDNPDEEIDLGLADSDWLVLWSVEWEEFEKIESKEPTLEKPDLESVRWQEICKLEQKEMMIRQFDLIQGEY